MNTIDVGRDKGGNFQSSRFGRVCDNGIRRRDGCSDFVRCEEPCSEDGEDAQGGIMVMVMSRLQRDQEFSIPGLPGWDFAKSRHPGIFWDGISLKFYPGILPKK